LQEDSKCRIFSKFLFIFEKKDKISAILNKICHFEFSIFSSSLKLRLKNEKKNKIGKINVVDF
jgi:hypothetical protein